MDLGLELLLFAVVLILGFVFFVCTIIIPVVKKSIRESKEYQELQDKIRAERKK